MDFDEINGAGGLRRNAYDLLGRMSDAGSPFTVTQGSTVFNLLINIGLILSSNVDENR